MSEENSLTVDEELQSRGEDEPESARSRGGTEEVSPGADPVPGATAAAPRFLPLRAWWQIARRVRRQVAEDNLSLLAAALAFYSLLSIFPALTAMVAIYGLLADPLVIGEQVALLRGIVPGEALGLLETQLERLLRSPSSGLGFGAGLSLLVLLWSGSNGMQIMIRAINLVYEEEETRSFVRMRALALGLTLAALLLLIVSIAAIAILPGVLERLGWRGEQLSFLTFVRWPALALVFLFSLAVLYRLAPDRRSPKWSWVTAGSLLASLLWLIISGLFSVYVEAFGAYGETYGSLGGVVVLLLWLYITAFVVLLGAEVNAETEHQTAVDSTVGPDRPIGSRNAWVADHRPTEDGGS